jgi:hypothetical protein
MEDRGVRRRLPKRTHDGPDNVSSASLDPRQRPDRSERERIRKFIHELYEELLSLAEAARSILHWPPANEIAHENPIKQLDPKDRSRTTTQDQAQEAGLEQTSDSFPSRDPPSAIPDPAEPGVQRKAPDASQLRPTRRRDIQ